MAGTVDGNVCAALKDVHQRVERRNYASGINVGIGRDYCNTACSLAHYSRRLEFTCSIVQDVDGCIYGSSFERIHELIVQVIDGLKHKKQFECYNYIQTSEKLHLLRVLPSSYGPAGNACVRKIYNIGSPPCNIFQSQPAVLCIATTITGMKRHIMKFILTAILVTAVFMAFAQDEKTAERDASVDLPKFNYALVDSAADFKRFKNEAELEISKNKKTIAELKNHKAKKNKTAGGNYKEMVSELEELNDDMAIKINTSEMIQTKNWTSFKREFKREMSELKTSIGNLVPNHGPI